VIDLGSGGALPSRFLVVILVLVVRVRDKEFGEGVGVVD
jgi:hypothetical protein